MIVSYNNVIYHPCLEPARDSCRYKRALIALQKRLFIEPFANLQDPVEIDLLYHQSITDLFEEKILLTKADVVSRCYTPINPSYP